jgi:hypothetical protein
MPTNPANGNVTLNSKIPLPGQKLSAESIPVVLASDSAPQPVTAQTATEAETTITRVTAAVASTLLVAAALRKGAIFYNDSTASCYLKLGGTASTTSFTQKMSPGSTFILEFSPIYVGQVTGIWDAVNGAMQVTEMV